MAREKEREYIEFLLGKELVKLSFNDTIRPTTTLLQYLRKSYSNKGTKEGCNVGDCGACTIVLVEVVNHELVYTACNACLIFLPQIHGKQIITVEHLEYDDELHPVQQAMVDLDASQCGFCTPGFIMSLFSLYKQTERVNKEDVLETFSGNLCRCTGYQSIINAAFTAFENKKPDHFDRDHQKTIEILSSLDENNGNFKNSKQIYFTPNCLEDALEFKNNNLDAQILSGATDVGLKVTKDKELLPNILDLTFVKSLKWYETSGYDLEIGAQVDLQVLKGFMLNYYPAFSKLLTFFGSKQIRNRSTLVGNIASASPIGDTLPFLMAVDAKLELKNLTSERIVSIREFITGYRQTLLENNELITKVFIPKPINEEIVDLYKLSKRIDLDISSVSVAVKLKLSDNNDVNNIEVYYGGMSEYTKRANTMCNYLIGKRWNKEVVEKAVKLIDNDFSPISDARSFAEGRLIMAQNLFLKFWTEHC